MPEVKVYILRMFSGLLYSLDVNDNIYKLLTCSKENF